jgi:hypothetical protein
MAGVIQTVDATMSLEFGGIRRKMEPPNAPKGF